MKMRAVLAGKSAEITNSLHIDVPVSHPTLCQQSQTGRGIETSSRDREQNHYIADSNLPAANENGKLTNTTEGIFADNNLAQYVKGSKVLVVKGSYKGSRGTVQGKARAGKTVLEGQLRVLLEPPHAMNTFLPVDCLRLLSHQSQYVACPSPIPAASATHSEPDRTLDSLRSTIQGTSNHFNPKKCNNLSSTGTSSSINTSTDNSLPSFSHESVQRAAHQEAPEPLLIGFSVRFLQMLATLSLCLPFFIDWYMMFNDDCVCECL